VQNAVMKTKVDMLERRHNAYKMKIRLLETQMGVAGSDSNDEKLQ
jgi:hypothetical protein